MASPIPKQHIPSCNAVDVITQVTIRPKDHRCTFGEALHDLTGIGRGHHHICHRFHSRCRVHVGNDRMTRMRLHKSRKLLRRTAICQRATGIQIGHQYLLVRTKNLGGLTHEMHTTQHDNIRCCLGCPLCQGQAIAYIIGNVLYVACLIVMRQDHRILLLAQLINRLLQVYLFWNGYIHIPY